jgi:hypothetical protein
MVLLEVKYMDYRKEPLTKIKFSIHLADHCNLNCRGCDHCAPLAKEWFIDPGEFERDFNRCSQLFNGEASQISLMGGEPLLHPGIEELLPLARRSFPAAYICITTNGLLLGKKDDRFWETAAANDIKIEVTPYPHVKKQWESLSARARDFGAELLNYHNKDMSIAKTSYFIPFDLTGSQPIEESFSKCSHANYCVHLCGGRLFTCTVAPNAHSFAEYFNKSLPLSPDDSIDIYQAGSAEEIFDFLIRPIPFCRFCRVDRRTFGLPWGRSKKSIWEWVTPDVDDPWLTKKITELENRLEAMKNKYELERCRNLKLKNSLSWKMTVPVRALGRALGLPREK